MRLKAVIITLAVGLGLGLAAQAATDAKGLSVKRIPKMMREQGFKHNTASWTTSTTQTTEDGKKTVSEAKFWLSGDKYRMESKDEKGKAMVMLDDGKDVYMVNMDEKKAYKWNEAAEKMFGQIMSSDIVAESARQRKTAKKLGSETVEGKPCEIYSYKTTLTMMNNTVTSDVKEWLWSKENFPIKHQIKTPKHKMKIVFMTTEVPGSETVSVIKDLALDKSIDEALFALPTGVKVEELQIPEGMGGMIGGGNAGAAAETPSEGKGSKGGKDTAAEEENQDGPPPAVKNMLKGLF